MKCIHCPVKNNEDCSGLLCNKVDPTSETYDERYLNVVRKLSGENIVDKTVGLTKSLVRFISNGAPSVTEEVQKLRLDICSDCEWFDPEKVVCNHCGCYLQIKTSWATESCPLDPPKWNSTIKKVKSDCGCSGA